MPTPTLLELAGEGALIEGGFRPGAQRPRVIEPDVLRRVRRRTLARLRRAVEPVEPAVAGPVPAGMAGHRP